MVTLRELRERRRLTQEELAREVDVTASTIARIEQGKSTPRFKLQRRLAGLFDVDVNTIQWSNVRAMPRENGGEESQESNCRAA